LSKSGSTKQYLRTAGPITLFSPPRGPKCGEYRKCVPPKPKEELINYYRDADVFVLPSIRETFGLVYAEAMTQGLPVIYSKGQGFDRQFEEGTVGFHAESRNAEEIADRIEDIMSNYQTISENCVRLSDRFNWSEIAKEYQRLYEDCVRMHPSHLN